MAKRALLAAAIIAAGSLTSTAATAAPPSVEVLFVVDRSASMASLEGRFARIEWIKNGILSVINELPPEARMGIVAFDAGAELVMPMQAYQRFDIARAFSRLAPAEGSNLHAALDVALATIAAEEPAPRMVFIYTDGIAAPMDYAPIAAAFTAAGTIVNPVVLGPTGDFRLEPLAAGTGGRFEAFLPFDILDGLMRTEILDWLDLLAATPR